MDPNANLREQAELLLPTWQVSDLSTYDRRRLSELRRALQAWLSSGGFAPDSKAYPDAWKLYLVWVRKSARFADLAR